MSKEELIPWRGPDAIVIPANAADAGAIVPYARALSPREQEKIVSAFNSSYYDMAAEFVWRRSMAFLRSTLASLGMRFIGEMLDRPDIDEFSTPDSVLTDYQVVQLAGALGVVNATGEMKLRHALEQISHYLESADREELSAIDALQITRSCVQFVLAEQNTQVAVDFSNIRTRLSSEALSPEDPQVVQLINSPPFFLRTVLRVLLGAIRAEAGASLERALGNLAFFLPAVWERLPEVDRWSVGKTYVEMTSVGNALAVAGMKRTLMRVKGFDYVPETVRSDTFRKAAKAVIDAHYGWSNWEAEISPTERLASLGTTIPPAAMAECIQAYMCVYLGNPYGTSFKAAPTAERELSALSPDRWEYYLEKLLPADDTILFKLNSFKPAARFIQLVSALSLQNRIRAGTPAFNLVVAASKGNHQRMAHESGLLIGRLRGTGA